MENYPFDASDLLLTDSYFQMNDPRYQRTFCSPADSALQMGYYVDAGMQLHNGSSSGTFFSLPNNPRPAYESLWSAIGNGLEHQPRHDDRWSWAYDGSAEQEWLSQATFVEAPVRPQGSGGQDWVLLHSEEAVQVENFSIPASGIQELGSQKSQPCRQSGAEALKDHKDYLQH